METWIRSASNFKLQITVRTVGKNSTTETRGARKEDPLTVLAGSSENLFMYPDASWETGGRGGGGLNHRALNLEGVLELLNQQKDGNQQVQSWQNFK